MDSSSKPVSDWDWEFDEDNYSRRLYTITWSSLKERIGLTNSFPDLDSYIIF